MKKLTLLISFISIFQLTHSQELIKKNNISLVIHGGAGTIERSSMSPEMEKAFREKLQEALLAGYRILESDGSSVEAVITAIKILEDSPLFNAGKGAVLTGQETIELDASIMNGKNKNAGAVAAITNVKNPIEAAYQVMEHSPHVMLVGSGAEEFAKEKGLTIVDPSYFFEQRRRDQLKRIKEKQEGNFRRGTSGWNEEKWGTVGAVALDSQGNIAAGTSTGGMANKKWGRVGDSPIIGAGTYADNESCGVSATGHGEFFIRFQVAYDIAALMKYKNMNLQDAAWEVVMHKLKEAGGEGGVIALDRDGNIAMPFNTSGMFRGFVKYQQMPQVFIYND